MPRVVLAPADRLHRAKYIHHVLIPGLIVYSIVEGNRHWRIRMPHGGVGIVNRIGGELATVETGDDRAEQRWITREALKSPGNR
jgi:hypothetical protein